MTKGFRLFLLHHLRTVFLFLVMIQDRSFIYIHVDKKGLSALHGQWIEQRERTREAINTYDHLSQRTNNTFSPASNGCVDLSL